MHQTSNMNSPNAGTRMISTSPPVSLNPISNPVDSLAFEHFRKDAAGAPDVDRCGVARLQQNLRRPIPQCHHLRQTHAATRGWTSDRKQDLFVEIKTLSSLEMFRWHSPENCCGQTLFCRRLISSCMAAIKTGNLYLGFLYGNDYNLGAGVVLWKLSHERWL